MKKKLILRVLFVVSALLSILLVVGCSDGNDNNNGSSSNGNTTNTTSNGNTPQNLTGSWSVSLLNMTGKTIAGWTLCDGTTHELLYSSVATAGYSVNDGETSAKMTNIPAGYYCIFYAFSAETSGYWSSSFYLTKDTVFTIN